MYFYPMTKIICIEKPYSAIYGVCNTPFGEVLLAATPQGICWLSLSGMDAFDQLCRFWGEENLTESRDVEPLCDKIFKGDYTSVVVLGSRLQKDVWMALTGIPRGEVATYSDIADIIGRPSAVRAVASAIGQNNVSYLIPCHRVIRKDGSYGGYRWGIEIKEKLLFYELKGRAVF